MNIAKGVVATDMVQNSLCGALEKGEAMAHAIVSEHLTASNPKSFFYPIQCSNVKTMAELCKKMKIRANNFSMDGEAMYLRLLTMNSFKKVPLQRVMSFENAPVPLTLFIDDGTITKCNKLDHAQT